MIYPSDLEQRIGFDKVRADLAAHCSTPSAREVAAEAPFLSDYDAVELALGQTREMRDILTIESDYPSGGHTDIGPFLGKIRIEGTHLDTDELVILGKALEVLAALTAFFKNKRNDDGRHPYPLLDELVQPVAGFDPVRKEIARIVDQYGRIRDNASPALAETRRELTRTVGQVDKKLQSILRAAQAAGLVEEDASVTMRDGRAVIPVAAGNKRKLKGLVHDESASGRTAYVEPIEIVELNNQIKELESAERREIIRILTAFTESLRPHAEALTEAAAYITSIDYIQAKGRYALGMNAVMPALEKAPLVELHQARHPLLEKALQKEGKPIVPLDLQLTTEKYILLISGPNAGGKSVCLKTVGLLQYMLQCGLLIPAQEDTRMGIFGSIFIDIGDQQSLDNDLSTYSSHLLNMKNMLRSADAKSLVLIDEFGSGTEPGTGGAIAEAILQQLEERHVWGVITTHYANLKYYAAGATGIINGAMTFDVQKITPLFRLEMGRPGSSFAFEIARKIGLPEEIIALATEKIGTQQVNVEKQIREAARDKRYWEGKRERIRMAEKHIDRTAAQYETQLAEIAAERQRIIREAKEKAAQLVAEANRQVENTIREIRESQAEKERTRTARAGLDAFRDTLAPDAADENDPIVRKMRKLQEQQAARAERAVRRGEQAAQGTPAKTADPKKPKEIEPGFKVRIKGQNTIGEVLNISGNKVAVAFNSVTTSVEKSRLEIVPHAEIRRMQRTYVPPAPQSYDTSSKRVQFRGQLDIRGERVADALAEVEEYIDEAIMLGIGKVSILHGKGTGALKEEVRKYLRTVPLVASVEDEHEEFGGAGITVVKLDI